MLTLMVAGAAGLEVLEDFFFLEEDFFLLELDFLVEEDALLGLEALEEEDLAVELDFFSEVEDLVVALEDAVLEDWATLELEEGAGAGSLEPQPDTRPTVRAINTAQTAAMA